MTLLSIDWSDRFLLAGIGVGMVLCILVAIVLVLQIFTFIAMKTTRKASEVKTNYKETKQAKSFDKASDEEKAAVAVVPGDAFETPNAVRFAYPVSVETINEGMDRIEAALKKLK